MMTPHEKRSALKSLENAWQEINKLATFTECKDCMHSEANYCNLWKSIVPNDIIKTGCEKWQFDDRSPPF